MFGIRLHTLIVHFPIALTFAVFFYDARGFYSRTPRLYGIGSSLTRFAALAAVVATATGFRLAGMSGLGSGGTVTGHAGLGSLTLIVLVTVAFLRYTAEARADSPEEAFRTVWLGIELLAVILVSVTTVIAQARPSSRLLKNSSFPQPALRHMMCRPFRWLQAVENVSHE